MAYHLLARRRILRAIPEPSRVEYSMHTPLVRTGECLNISDLYTITIQIIIANYPVIWGIVINDGLRS